MKYVHFEMQAKSGVQMNETPTSYDRGFTLDANQIRYLVGVLKEARFRADPCDAYMLDRVTDAIECEAM